MTIELPAPTGRVVAAVMRRMTGKLPRNLPDEMPIPLSFDEDLRALCLLGRCGQCWSLSAE